MGGFLAVVAAIVAAQYLLAPAPPGDLVVVVPSADGHVGSVVIERDGKRTVVDQAYVASRGGETVKLDEAEVRKLFAEARSSIPARPAVFQLYFIAGSDELTEASKPELARMLEELKRRPAPDILVIGHTDTVGGLTENDRLSLARAERVRQSFVAQGIPVERIHAAGRGKREPVVPTADNVDEPRNRRVEINVR
jgi:outer membrane protein OmpA-like peptidoglycan-associated protein